MVDVGDVSSSAAIADNNMAVVVVVYDMVWWRAGGRGHHLDVMWRPFSLPSWCDVAVDIVVVVEGL